ncbi:MAG: MerR family transcriptional regulator [Solirubrobacterales bacterium]
MENRLKIGDFIKLTGSTLKTVVYYHKIGLLPDPERSAGGYRLYGPAELDRMRMIKRLKSLGLDLPRIKAIIGDLENPKTLQETLQSLRAELLIEKKVLEDRVAKIDTLLDEDVGLRNETHSTPSFQMITAIMGTDQLDRYAQTCPELFDQHRKLYGILDDYQWGEDYRETFQALAEYFKLHPEQYQMALESGARLSKLSQLQADDPQIEAMAREAAALVNRMPQVKKLLDQKIGMQKPLENVYQEMVAGVMSPAQIKYQQLFEAFLQVKD